MKVKILISIASIVILLSVVFCIFELNNFFKKPLIPEQLKTIEPVDTPVTVPKTHNIPISTGSVSPSIPPSSSPKATQSPYSYLFVGSRDANTSNIVGYFAHGAFAWYVPDWLVTNWEMKPFRAEGMIFSPKVRTAPTTGLQYDFSDIEFDVSTSTELNNANNMYQTMLGAIPKNEIIISEVLLNKSTADMVSIQMENNTRIYHITAYTGDFKRISDIYFMDGNGKTLDLRFETKADIFPQFSDKIRDMVEGIGELKAPQG